MAPLSEPDLKQINALVDYFLKNEQLVRTFQRQVLAALTESQDLSKIVHSLKTRIKDPEHLRDKLARKLKKCKEDNTTFQINESNLLTEINDLGGIRLLHLYTRQIEKIDSHLREIFAESGISIKEGPFARTWDDESREFFKQIGIETQASPTLYTSVHYVVESNSRTTVTCEIQVRTLMEEVWGEVDHSINYPHKTESVACREQILALARSTSSATRLVDAIFTTLTDFQQNQKMNIRVPVKRRKASGK